MSVGKLIPTKGHDLAIAAAGRAGIEHAPRHRLSRIQPGGGGPRCSGWRTTPASISTVRVGVHDEQLVELYQHALVTLYLSYAEPFGLVSIEAQACGTPVIVSDEGGLPETIIAGVTGWAVPRSSGAVAARRHVG